jgi:4-amino-4-deoxy-L-arabinose transferase-like glycosyltransferase
MTKPSPAFLTGRSRLTTALFAIVIVLVYLSGLTLPLLGPDEPRYAQVAREMFERDDWVTPTLGGFNWFEKPALLYWLEIVWYHVFGVTEFAARFGSALFGLGTIASLWLLGRAIEKRHAELNGLADLSALIAATTAGMIAFSHGATFDIIVTFPMTAAMVCFLCFDLTEREGRMSLTPLAGFYFFCGLALLAKGLIGVLFPFAIISVYYAASLRLPSKTFVLSLIWGGLITAAVAATWYVPMYLRHGYAFIDEFFIQHHFQRFTSNKYKHPQPFHFFFWVLPLMTIPWLPFFLVGLWSSVKSLAKRSGPDGRNRLTFSPSPVISFAVSWLLVPLLFFSFSGSKLPGYILPALPPAVVITSICVLRLSRERRWIRTLTPVIAVGTFVVVFGIVNFVAPALADADSTRSLIAAADQGGYSSAKVLSFRSLSHNAEFYAAGRLVRDMEGKQRAFYSPTELAMFVRENGGMPVLVLAHPEHMTDMLTSPELRCELIREAGETGIYAVVVK